MEERQLRLHETYRKIDGGEFVVNRWGSGGSQAYCSDGWWRYARGLHAGLYVGQESNPNFRYHVNPSTWLTEAARHVQLLLL